MASLIAVLIAAGAAGFVLVTGQELPPVVASHFNASGQPDNYMARDAFVTLMAVLTSVLPLAVWWLQCLQARAGTAKIAHGVHWFAAQRRAQTEAWLRLHATVFAAVLSCFLAYVFWLTVWAHRQDPVQLPERAFWIGLAAFMIFTALWVYAQHRRFSHPT